VSAASPYPELGQLLSDSHAVTEPAEAHGTLVGALCAVGSYALDDWLAEILPEGPVPVATSTALTALYQATVGTLLATDMQFDLLMPDEAETLEERTRALGLWCNGFLYGLGSNGAADPRQLSADVAEIVRDLGEISRAGVDGQDSEEANEAAFAELVEFVRVGVQLVYEELVQKRTPPPMLAPSATLH
jgi:uncharacterized protein YgfB (UPF0149 family)